MSGDSNTTIYLGNLKPSARILPLKHDLYSLIRKTLKVNITENDISIINGRKRYAVIEVHSQQNIDFLLENLVEKTDRQNLKFDFLKIVDEGVLLHVDTVKSQDEDQAKADFENTKNKKPFAGRRSSLDITRPDFGRAIALKSRSSKSSTSGPRTSSRISNHTTRGEIKIPSRSTDLDVTLEAEEEGDIITAVSETKQPQIDEGVVVKSSATGVPAELVGMKKEDVGETINKKIHMIPLSTSSVKEDTYVDELDDEIPTPTPINSTMDLSHDTGGDDSPEPYEEIDLRQISRATLRGKLTPRIHRRRSEKDSRAVGSATRRDFFQFLDRQIGLETPDVDTRIQSDDTGLETPDVDTRIQSDDTGSIHDEGTPYYKAGEMVYNHDLSKDFKAYLDGTFTLKKMREHAARCICGFLNSDRKGMLLIGVHNDGCVCGIECEGKQEDRYHQNIVEAAKEIYPPVYEEDYAINFAPLLEDNGRQHPSLKVIEVRVMPPENLDTLYECKEGVFIRRNGILTGPIRPNHIQEWVKQKHFSDINSMKLAEENMQDELDQKDLMIRRQADTIMAQKSEIEQQRELLLKTRTCVLL